MDKDEYNSQIDYLINRIKENNDSEINRRSGIMFVSGYLFGLLNHSNMSDDVLKSSIKSVIESISRYGKVSSISPNDINEIISMLNKLKYKLL